MNFKTYFVIKYLKLSTYYLGKLTLAGFPTAIDPFGMSRVTTLPAPFLLAFIYLFL